MLLIGSVGRNVGKTHLACALIKKFGKTCPIIAVKVTTIEEKNGKCPHGGTSCGICASLEGDFSIVEETNPNLSKDTSKLLAAGAAKVFWLRTLKTHLEQAAEALLDVIGKNSVCICESNSLRFVVEPGAFLILARGGSEAWKSSAGKVLKYADRIVSFNGTCFAPEPEKVGLIDGRWAIPFAATAIIMAGGPASRMGCDKAMLPINGRPIIQHIYDQLKPHFDRVLISTNHAAKYSFPGAKCVADKIPNRGPLMGIASALAASNSELNFVVACDIPDIDMAFVKKMLFEARDYDVVMPKTGPARYEPLFAVYKKGVFKAMEAVFAEGRSRIIEIFDRCKVKFVGLADAEWYKNLNTLKDYEEYSKKRGVEVRQGI